MYFNPKDMISFCMEYKIQQNSIACYSSNYEINIKQLYVGRQLFILNLKKQKYHDKS